MSCYIEQVPRISFLVLVGMAIVAALLYWLAVVVERAPVSRERVEQFARRHRLVITSANGNQVIRYLAVTRRWRTSGLALSAVAMLGWAATAGGFRINTLTLFVGWFIGALIAELRLAQTPSGPRRAASLTPRSPGAYLPRSVWALVPIATVLSLAVTAAGIVQAARGRPVPTITWLLSGAAVAVAAAVLALQRRAVRRAQPAAEPDVVAADDAIRSRSLHVLAGGGLALVLYLALGQAQALAPAMPGQHGQQIRDLSAVAFVVGSLIGWAVASSPWAVRRAESPAPPVPASGAR
jgi:hypothetical protein